MFKRIIWLIMVSVIPNHAAVDCEMIKREVKIFKDLKPSGIRKHRDYLKDCNIETINDIEVNDYFDMEYDSLLTMSYLSLKKQTTHPRLMQYYLDTQRWDLLLMTLNKMRRFDKPAQINALHQIFYQDLPFYFAIEIKEVFNFFTEPEKLLLSQLLLPVTPKKLRHLNINNAYIVKFWPQFDQLVFMNHLRQELPEEFDKLSKFWREKLMSYHYDNADKDPSFVLLKRLLSGAEPQESLSEANESFQFYYLVKTNQFDQATQFLKSTDKQVFFNNIRYFQFFTPDQQSYLLDNNFDMTISDIKQLFETVYFQLDEPAIKQWIWSLAIKEKLNLDTILENPILFIDDIPQQFSKNVKVLSPKINYIKQDSKKIDHFFTNDPTTKTYPTNMTVETIGELTRFYNGYKKIPHKDPKKIIQAIIPYIKLENHQNFIELLPYLSFQQQMSLIKKFPAFELIPIEHSAAWSRWYIPELFKRSD